MDDIDSEESSSSSQGTRLQKFSVRACWDLPSSSSSSSFKPQASSSSSSVTSAQEDLSQGTPDELAAPQAEARGGAGYITSVKTIKGLNI